MERNGLRIGSFAGAPIILDWTVAILAAYLVFTDLSRDGLTGLPQSLLFVAALMVAILVHEFGHAGVAALFKIRAAEIVLTFFGGYVQFINPPQKRWQDMMVSAAGPGANLALWWLVDFAMKSTLVSDGTNQYLIYFLLQLAYVNLLLGLFNLLPGFPLDGGAVVRSFLSYFLRVARARWVAAWLGVVIATGLGFYGLATGQIWTAGIAVMLALQAFNEVNVTSRVLNGR